MNQILVTDKLYVTPKLKRKKKIYRIEFILSLIMVISLTGWYIYKEIDKNTSEAVSHEIYDNMNMIDTTVAEEQALVVAFEDETEVIADEQQETPIYMGSYTDKSGRTYTYESVLSIPNLGIQYPVLSETTDELLKISLNKFWGGNPNSVGNYCIVGHNYKSGKMFGKLSQIKNGDKVYLQDMSGKKVEYKVYDKFSVYPDNTACTSQITNGKRELTLITCTNQGKKRLVVKCREEV